MRNLVLLVDQERINMHASLRRRKEKKRKFRPERLKRMKVECRPAAVLRRAVEA